jgi:glycogen synthase
MYRLTSSFLTVIFLFTCIFPPDIGYSQIYSSLNLPVPGTMVFQTTGFVPTMIKGIEIDLENPLSFHFIIDTGDSGLQGKAFEEESLRLIKYFLASLTVPEEEMWVNLSPYEQDRIIPEDFGRTAMGMDLLAEDYLLKQLTASLMYPEKELGQKFWDRVYARAKKEWGTTDIPVDAFHKVWIVPKDAEVVQIGNRAFVAKSSLEVMLEQDYFALREAQDNQLRVTGNELREKENPSHVTRDSSLNQLQTEIMKEIILPEIEKEVNEGENFANLRQIYQGMILATWFKVTLKESLLGKIYVDQNKVAGVESPDPAMTQAVYDRYIEAFQKGVYNYIKEDPDSETGNVIPRHYFSGGFSTTGRDGAMLTDKVMQATTTISPDPIDQTDRQRMMLARAVQPNRGDSEIFLLSVNLNDPKGAEKFLENIVMTEVMASGLDPHQVRTFIQIYERLIQRTDTQMVGLKMLSGLKMDLSSAIVAKNEAVVLEAKKESYQQSLKVLNKALADPAMLTSLQKPDLIEPLSSWYRLDRPLEILDEILQLKDFDGKFKSDDIISMFKKYSTQVAAQEDVYWVQSTWPVLKALTLLKKNDEIAVLDILEKEFAGKRRPLLVDAFFLMNNHYSGNWLQEQVPYVKGRPIYYYAAEIHHWSGGLGPVMKFHGKGMHDLGADVIYIEPGYQFRQDRPGLVPLDYTDPNEGLTDLKQGVEEFTVLVGDKDGKTMRRVRVRVDSGIDENGCLTYLIRDVQDDGSSYYTKMLYNYATTRNLVTIEEFEAFFNIAAATFTERLEQKRLEKEGSQWKPAIAHTNDGQTAPLQAVALSLFENSPVIQNIFWAFTTHTYGNRGGSSLDWGKSVFLKHMMRIKDKYVTAFNQWQKIDHTSGGVRLANVVNGVSNKHRDDVAPIDSHAKVSAVTNGAVPEIMAKIFREEFLRFKEQGVFDPEADYERPTEKELGLVKVKTKQRLNERKIATANGGVLEVDLDKPLIGCVRRLVSVKAGRNRAFSDKNIWRLVALGYNVVILGAHQGTSDSENLAAGLRYLEKEIQREKLKNPQNFPGKFVFVQHFTAEDKIAFLAAKNVQVQDSDNHTGAAEFSEEDSTSNGAFQGGGTFREGVIVDQGIILDFSNPDARGNTLVPKEDTEDSWYESVYVPLMDLWNDSRRDNHGSFYQKVKDSPRLNRVQRYLNTSAAYLRTYNKGLETQALQAEYDGKEAFAIASRAGASEELVGQLLKSGRNGVKEPFKFVLIDGSVFSAGGNGLNHFMKRKKELQEQFGFDALLHHYLEGHYFEYLGELFSGLEAAEKLNGWLDELKKSDASTYAKEKRLENFLIRLIGDLESFKIDTVEQEYAATDAQQQGSDKAMLGEKDVGGIDLNAAFLDLKIRRDDQGLVLPLSQQPLDELMDVSGLIPVIINITPVQSLPMLLGIKEPEENLAKAL